jgi:glycosyltransferase involved in cell wall biosynthesis
MEDVLTKRHKGEDGRPLRFSIVIPCFNEENFIANTLKSLKDQDFDGKYEIIVVDNNSTDNTVNIAKAYGARVVRESHLGVCWARQKGTSASRGEIVVSTDADSVFDSNWLSRIDRHFGDNQNIVGVAGPCHYNTGPWWGKVYPLILFGAVSIGSKIFGRPFYVTATNISFRRSAWQGYNTALSQGGDELDLLRNLKTKGKVVFVNSMPIYTSGRRLYRGLLYSLFVSFFFYYFLAYYLNRMFEKPVIGGAPIYRAEQEKSPVWLAISRITSLGVTLLILFNFSYIADLTMKTSSQAFDDTVDLVLSKP